MRIETQQRRYYLAEPPLCWLRLSVAHSTRTEGAHLHSGEEKNNMRLPIDASLWCVNGQALEKMLVCPPGIIVWFHLRLCAGNAFESNEGVGVKGAVWGPMRDRLTTDHMRRRPVLNKTLFKTLFRLESFAPQTKCINGTPSALWRLYKPAFDIRALQCQLT